LFPKTFVKKKDRLRQWIEIDRKALVHNLHQFQKLIGKDGREIITAEHLASLAGTISYEILARLNPQTPRIVV